MKRNVLLILAIIVSLFLGVNSFRRILSLQSTAREVELQEVKLSDLRRENEDLKRELDYKSSERFAEEEIRNKLGLAKEGEEIVVVPKKDEENNKQETINKKPVANWKKWKKLIFGNG